MSALQKWVTTALPVCGLLLLSMPAAKAQYYGSGYGYGASPYGSIGTPSQGSLLQDVASGLLSSGQANGIQNRENSLAQRAAKLLRNDGGVLTPNDAAKLNKEALSINRQASREMANNNGSGVLGGGVGTGLLGSLFGGGPVGGAGMVAPGMLNGLTGLGGVNPYYGYGNNYTAGYNGLYNNSAYPSYGSPYGGGYGGAYGGYGRHRYGY